MSSRLSIAVLVRQHRALAFGYHTCGPCPRGASQDRATCGASWLADVPFAGPFPTSARERVGSVTSPRGSGYAEDSARAVQNVVPGFCGVPGGVGLRRSPPNPYKAPSRQD